MKQKILKLIGEIEELNKNKNITANNTKLLPENIASAKYSFNALKTNNTNIIGNTFEYNQGEAFISNVNRDLVIENNNFFT